jgi:hypothetical protein
MSQCLETMGVNGFENSEKGQKWLFFRGFGKNEELGQCQTS